MPPFLFAALQAPFTRLAHILFPAAMANGIISGSFTFCEFGSMLSSGVPNRLLQIFCMTACTMRE